MCVESAKCKQVYWIMHNNYFIFHAALLSLPARGAWIEMAYFSLSRSAMCGRSPPGERGLKFLMQLYALFLYWSLPARGAWIEIFMSLVVTMPAIKSLPARGAWIEI